MRDWESDFRKWAKPPGVTEEQRIENAEKSIRNAIRASEELRNREVRVFTQGSYKNNTNVRGDSDVDIAVVAYQTFFPYYPEGTTKETFGNVSSNYRYATFKNQVEQALADHFGRTAVKRGNKAFDVHENTYHVEADVAPFFEHRRYRLNGQYLSGVELRPDSESSPKVINWPEQHYKNGVNKNNETGRRFKAMVRILKFLRNEMSEAGVTIAHEIPGFLIECLVWNVPDDHLGHSSYTEDIRSSLAYLFNNTRDDDTCAEWGEVSELKYLFCPVQKWTRQQANAFLDTAWDYIGFA